MERYKGALGFEIKIEKLFGAYVLKIECSSIVGAYQLKIQKLFGAYVLQIEKLFDSRGL